MRAFDLACTVPWAIRPDALRAILDLAARAEVSPEVVAAAMSGTPQAVAARLGRPLDNARRVTVRDGVAVLPVNGPIFRYANVFSEISGATSSEILATDLTEALENPNVSAILLEIDSPGGEVAGTAELAAMIRAADASKPVHAYVDDLGASAAYWLAAATRRITVAPTAIVGSIGVVSALRDPAKTKSDEIEFVSSQSPKKRADIGTEAGRAQIQTVVDALADVFVADVARYRGVSVETVLADFGQGDVFVGQAAVDAGLADGLGSFEQALADVAGAAQQRGGRAARIGRAAVGFRDKFMAWLDSQDAPASADQEAAIVTDNLARQPAPAPTAPPAATDDRVAALQAELDATKAAASAYADQSRQLADRVKAMETDARRKRFTDEVMGKSDASSIRWFGEPGQHVAMLEHLADSAGEDSELFAAYVAQQRALAEQMRSSKLFEEVGSGQSGAGGGDAAGRLTAMAGQRVAEGRAKNFGEAMAQLEREQPALFAEYRAGSFAGASKQPAE